MNGRTHCRTVMFHLLEFRKSVHRGSVNYFESAVSDTHHFANMSWTVAHFDTDIGLRLIRVHQVKHTGTLYSNIVHQLPSPIFP